MKTITLYFKNPNNPALGGVANGREAYEKQVRPNIDRQTLKGELCIRFPDYISIIGDSFIRGFARPMIDEIGWDGVRKRVHFVTCREELTEELYDGMV